MASEDHDLGAQDAAIASLAVERCARRRDRHRDVIR
jgi:hypothetical protein